VRHNARVAVERSGCDLIAIVKANGYGLGAVPIAKALADTAKMFGVACISEAAALRSAGIEHPILLLGACLPADRAKVIEHDLIPCLSSLDEAMAWNELVSKKKIPSLTVHLVVDTGMGRLGIPERDLTPELVHKLKSLRHLHFEAISSHFPSADYDRAFTKRQIKHFAKIKLLAAENGLCFEHSHLGNSAGILGYPKLRAVSDLVRPGLLLYGVSPFPKLQPLLKPVLAWKTHITLIRELPRGHGISYGSTFVIRRKKTRVATLAVGYGDGYSRALSGQGTDVLIRGKRCPLLGRVTMDQIMVDVSAVKDAAIGDTAVLVGRQGDEEITVWELARKADMIPWEVLTRLTARVEH
jgi:alanine racemase